MSFLAVSMVLMDGHCGVVVVVRFVGGFVFVNRRDGGGVRNHQIIGIDYTICQDVDNAIRGAFQFNLLLATLVVGGIER